MSDELELGSISIVECVGELCLSMCSTFRCNCSSQMLRALYGHWLHVFVNLVFSVADALAL